MIHGLFINQRHSQCSIYEAGVIIKDILKTPAFTGDPTAEYTIDYVETDASLNGVNFKFKYDFSITNWHPLTLSPSKQTLDKLHGKKIAVVLEVTPETPFIYTPSDWFDAYMVIDPTKTKGGTVYPFPRPLETAQNLKPLLHEDRVVIGSFGFLVPFGPGVDYKRFHEVVENANKIRNCLVRFNFPVGTYTGISHNDLIVYGNYLKGLACNGVEVQVTHNYTSKADLINWCAENTVNAFPYYRNLPGLSAVTDQAITANRPIIVTDSVAFRHMHPYISYYPKNSYTELIESTLPGIKQMQNDWSQTKFIFKFRELLVEQGIL